MRKIPEDFKQITTLQALDNYLSKDEITIKIGFCGGRKFEHKGSEGDLTLNDIVRMFGKKVYESHKYSDNLLENKDLVKTIKDRIKALDNEANDKLSNRGLFTRLMHYIRKNDLVIKKQSPLTSVSTYTRKDVLDEISSLVNDLKNEHDLKAKQVKNAFNVVFDHDHSRYYSNPFPDLTQEIKSTKSALTEFVKVNSQKNAEELMNKVKELIKKAKGLFNKNRQDVLCNERLEELIFALVNIDYNLAAFMFAAFCYAREEDVDTIFICSEKLKKLHIFGVIRMSAKPYYKDYKESKDSNRWWPEIKVNIFKGIVLRICDESFE